MRRVVGSRVFAPLVIGVACLGSWLMPTAARADEFAAGSLIIPMDNDFQDLGIFRAYGLVYQLLLAGVPVRWVIRSDKLHGEADFSAAATDVLSGDPVPMHDYRGGPWVVDVDDAAAAMPIIAAWQLDNPQVAVHEATGGFEADVARYLVVAPTIAMIADGNQKIARKYMAAAGIADSTGDLLWPDTSPDMLDITELSGPTEDNHRDGSLFDDEGDPVYCQLMSMHWGIGDAEQDPEVVAEVRAYLNNPVHFFAECQAVNAFENLDPHGFFLTPNGFLIGDSPNAVDYFNPTSPYVQIDGEFAAVGGSEPSYTLPPGDDYLAGGTTMITGAGTPIGVEDVWMTGFLDGACPPTEAECGSFGKISYLGGHEYKTDVPLSQNSDSQGTRLFLNSLFEAPCATVDGLPTLNLAAAAPAYTAIPDLDVDVVYVNASPATALDAVLRAPLPANTSFVSASDGGSFDGTDVVWDLGNLGPDEGGEVSFAITLADYGLYDNSATLEYRVGLNDFALPSNVVQTLYDSEPPADTGDGTADGTTDAGTTDAGTTDAGTTDAGTTGTGTGTDGGDEIGATGTDGADEVGGTADAGANDVGDDGCNCSAGEAEPRGAPLPWLLGVGWWLGRRFRRRAGGEG